MLIMVKLRRTIMDKLRVGILGLGLGRQRALGYLQNENVNLCAVCDVDEKRVKRFITEHPDVKGYDDLETMLKHEKLDIVNVSTPDWMHLEHSVSALKNGCNVLLEKPMVTSIADAETLIKAVDASGQKLMVGQNYRRIPLAVHAKQLIAEGALGKIFHAVSTTYQNKFGQFASSPWYASKEHPRAALLGTGIHAVDMLRWLIGEVEEAFAYSNHLAYADFPDDDFITAVFRFNNGIIGRVDVAYACVLPRSVGGISLQLYGTKGSLDNDKVFISGSANAEWERRIMPSLKDSFWQEIDYFVDCILKNQAPVIDAREGARNVAACLAGVEATRTGKPVVPKRF
jgi:UDP-N-acetyl-2-amino-2-deoxyglucuronate dehydrogenase